MKIWRITYFLLKKIYISCYYYFMPFLVPYLNYHFTIQEEVLN